MTEEAEVEERLYSVEKRAEELNERLERVEKKLRTDVRVADTEQGKRIVLENTQETWFSPNYFGKILDRLDSEE